MAAAVSGAKNGHQVHIYEKNEKLGKKIYITGKGRCNVTNACDIEDLFANMVTNGKFMYSSFYGFTNQDVMKLLEDAGCPLKIERGNRVFPVSDKASDVTAAFSRLLRGLNVEIHYRQEVKALLLEDGACRGIVTGDGKKVRADSVLIATGGLSYPTTGSTGDGYKMAAEAGHKITECFPALVPFQVKEQDVAMLQGLALKNIGIKILKGSKVLYEDFGEMLFTHFGVSGPVLISASSYVGKQLRKGPLELSVDMKPALTKEQLDARLLREFSQLLNKQFKNSLGSLFPSKLIPVIISRCGISPEKQVNEITKEERRQLAEVTKDFRLTLTGLRGYSEAIVTQGGVSVKEVNPSTMESKRMPGLYFAGEVLDIDGVTGGFNLQIAWSTGWLAGMHMGQGG